MKRPFNIEINGAIFNLSTDEASRIFADLDNQLSESYCMTSMSSRICMLADLDAAYEKAPTQISGEPHRCECGNLTSYATCIHCRVKVEKP